MDGPSETTALALNSEDVEDMRRHAIPALDVEGQPGISAADEKELPVKWSFWPKQIFFIMGNEICERFSFYGLRAILVVHMTTDLLIAPSTAEAALHAFTATSYLLPLFGGWLADNVLGKYRTVLYLSVFYCLGHGVLAAWETRAGLAVGLGLITVGAGGIKPCVAAMVGDQFDKEHSHQLDSVFAMFYWCINLGSFFAMAMTPIIMQFSVFWAFSIPGIFMAIALFIFWAGRHLYILHEPNKDSRPAGALQVTIYALRQNLNRVPNKGFWDSAEERFSTEEVEGAKAVAALLPLFGCLSMFSALFDQHSSTWVVQAQQMNLRVFGWEMPPAQMQSLNPMLVMLLIPILEGCVYPAVTALGVGLTPLRKMSAGMVTTTLSFVVIALLQVAIDMGKKPSVLWQAPAYIILSASEVLVSATGLQFAYTQAPHTVKSTVLSLWLLTVFLGNVLDAVVTGANVFSGTVLFFFFAGLMLSVAILFIYIAVGYAVRDYSASGRALEAPLAAARIASERKEHMSDEALLLSESDASVSDSSALRT